MSRKPKTSRMRKVNELLREVIAAEVMHLKDPRIGFVTVTGVDTSPDLRRATVFYSVLGSEEEQVATKAALAHAAPHLQRGLAGQVRLKFTPKLSFAVDASVENGLKMGKILADIERSDAERATAANDEEHTDAK